ncbi:MAG: DNA alkylation repair protein [Bacteroidota bacterium]|nr:DNA alkylation repair protein [Bacteroidota bacterium]MDX5431554.1 DNA alkylation repair protein [Bacteroidota bacterium]MDX5470275.1 DNA alkylation repair protein [Bacteroidota bacterium]
MYSPEFIQKLGDSLQSVTQFPSRTFQSLVMDADWEARELKDRSKHIARCLRHGLSGDYPKQIEQLYAISEGYSGFTAIVFSDFVELFGLPYWELSMQAMHRFTQLCTAEFAVRPFFIQDYQAMVKQHLVWSKDQNHHVRRLASEGIRPRLPWGMGVPLLKKEPQVIFPILANLVEDESEYVRRSVANNLNDISKDHPDLVLRFVKSLDLKNQNTRKLVKHALRGLLKQAHPEALALFGFGDALSVNLKDFFLENDKVEKGGDLLWGAKLEIKGKGALRLEYHVHYCKANGTRSKKVFQISEQHIEAQRDLLIQKKQSFRDLTTRVHYPGIHRIELVANGKSIAGKEFELLTSPR